MIFQVLFGLALTCQTTPLMTSLIENDAVVVSVKSSWTCPICGQTFEKPIVHTCRPKDKDKDKKKK